MNQENRTLDHFPILLREFDLTTKRKNMFLENGVENKPFPYEHKKNLPPMKEESFFMSALLLRT
ncbi:hypothetical protein CVN76_27885 [Bacillus sp. mrc49]|nr:hypothetical protein CVN76_27885 [Bacillus sp. mrc49]